MSNPLIPNLNTFADLIDRLIVEINKLSFFENKKREEHAKENPDIAMISHWDNLSRDACEYRSLLKNEINKLLTTIIESKEYKTLQELRTFRRPARELSEILADTCLFYANNKEKLVAALEEDLCIKNL